MFEAVTNFTCLPQSFSEGPPWTSEGSQEGKNILRVSAPECICFGF